MGKLPAFQFYPSDWRGDLGVQTLSLHDQGVWINILCLMHESEERGKLLVKGKPLSMEALARLLGSDKQSVNKSIDCIIASGVAEYEYSESGSILINRRMVRDEAIRKKRAECGKLGGNPNLVNQKTTKEQPNNKNDVNQKTTPSSSSSYIIYNEENLFQEMKTENEQLWLSTRNLLTGKFQSDAHLDSLLMEWSKKFYLEPWDTKNILKHKHNHFRSWVEKKSDLTEKKTKREWNNNKQEPEKVVPRF